MMKRYEIDDFSIISSFPYSFQVSNENESFRLRESNPDPEANYPLPIRIEEESFTENHVLMYTPSTYMRLNWSEDPDEGGNGQLEMGRCDFSKDYDQFIQWNVLLNELPQSLISLVIQILRNPENVKHLEAPLIPKNPNNPYNSNYENLPSLKNNASPPPPPPPSPPKSPKKRKFKIAKKVENKTQRRRRNV